MITLWRILVTLLWFILVTLMFLPMLWLDYRWDLRRCSADAANLFKETWT